MNNSGPKTSESSRPDPLIVYARSTFLSRLAARGVLVVLAAAALFPLAENLGAQAPQTERRRVEGRVVRPAPARDGDTTAVVTVPDLWVTLHRVAPNLAGPLDSMRTDRNGAYRFTFNPSGGPEAIYFVSASYGGIAYFTNPLRGIETTGIEAEIAVFDTTSRVFPLTVRGRHLIVGSLDTTGSRTVVEIFELSNDSTRTLIADDTPDADPTWVIAVPLAARDVKAGQGDLPADAFVQSAGKVSLYAALAPGLKQLSFSYSVNEKDFPLEFAITDGAVVLEVLLEEADARVTGANLLATAPVALEGRQFQRYLAQDVRAGSSIVVEAPGSGMGGRGLYVTVLLGAIGFLMLMALLRAGIRKQKPLEQTGVLHSMVADVPTPERLAREIADLDAAYAAHAAPSDAMKVAYERRRAELAAVLREELAATGTRV